jgi:hypothetical protein
VVVFGAAPRLALSIWIYERVLQRVHHPVCSVEEYGPYVHSVIWARQIGGRHQDFRGLSQASHAQK